MTDFLAPATDVTFWKKLLSAVLQVAHGAVQVAKIAVLAGLAAFATDKIHKEYVTRKVILHSTELRFLAKHTFQHLHTVSQHHKCKGALA